MKIEGPMNFVPQSFQGPFYRSTALFPCRLAPWGDGKTLCMIMKGMFLSLLYPGNEGLIIRTRYNALQRSTIRDFQAWTGLKVPEQKQMVEIPGTGSIINFTHADNVEEFRFTIQGMNLGWVGIEQADELPSGDILDMLQGRLRRILTPNMQVQEWLIASGYLQDFTNFKTLAKDRREAIEQVIIEILDLPVRQIMVIANQCGHNWVYKRWVKNPIEYIKLPESDREIKAYELSLGKPFENRANLPATTLAAWEQLRVTSPKKYARFVMNSSEDYDIEGSYYASLMSDALKDKRVELDGLYDSDAPVYTFWDLGVSDETVIWFVQFVGSSIHQIDYYSNSGEGMEHYSNVLNDKPYIYAEHYVPHDVQQRMQGQQVTTRLDILRNLRFREDVYVVDRHSVAERIQAVRSLLHKCKFDNKCEAGVECLNRYHREPNKLKSTDEKQVFLDHPAHDEFCMVAGTKIQTTRGQVPIENVVVGDYVLTPFGEKPVLRSGKVRNATELIKIITTKGNEIICTPEHKIFYNNDLIKADALPYMVILFRNTIWRRLLWKLLNLTVINTGFKRAISSGLVRQHYTKPSGKNIMGLFRRAIGYITKTKMPEITTYQISNLLIKENMTFCMVGGQSGWGVKKILNSLQKPVKKQRYGTQVKRGKRFIPHSVSSVGKTERGSLKIVPIAAKNTSVHIPTGLSIVLVRALITPIGQIVRIGKAAIALFAVGLLRLTNTINAERVAEVVRINLANKSEPVYDLSIGKDHCYYANNILVSNSHGADAFGYMAIAFRYHPIGGTILGYQGAVPEWEDNTGTQKVNLLGVR